MVLPLYLALTAAEILSNPPVPSPCAYMACHFSPYMVGLSKIPDSLPPGSVLMLNDRLPCQGHSPDLVTSQLSDTVKRLGCESILLDFQRPPEPESQAMVEKIVAGLSCPVAVTERFAIGLNCPVFLSPGPLHMPLSEYLQPWQNRQIWLEAALCQEDILITDQGMTHNPIFPTEQLDAEFYDEDLRCCYRTEISKDSIRFTLYDTTESLEKKLELAGELGVTQAVGLWQELGTFQTGK